jgi:membrane-associated phospholipid phosphatase
MLLNKTLKQLIGEPRPGEATEKNVYKGYENTKGAEIYGMPSGHAQSVLFSTIYTYLVTKTESVLIGGGFISMLSLIQRYKFKRHSIKQLIVGSLLGAGVALFGYNISTFYLTCK